MKVAKLLRETKVELASVNWPNRAQTINYTMMVIVFSVAIAALLGAFDLIFVSLLELII